MCLMTTARMNSMLIRPDKKHTLIFYLLQKPSTVLLEVCCWTARYWNLSAANSQTLRAKKQKPEQNIHLLHHKQSWKSGIPLDNAPNIFLSFFSFAGGGGIYLDLILEKSAKIHQHISRAKMWQRDFCTKKNDFESSINSLAKKSKQNKKASKVKDLLIISSPNIQLPS